MVSNWCHAKAVDNSFKLPPRPFVTRALHRHVVPIRLGYQFGKEHVMDYTTRGLRKRSEDSWQARLSHKNPLTGETETTYHTIKAKTERQAQKKRDELIIELQLNGLAIASEITIKDFMESYLAYKTESKTIEPSTIKGYKSEVRQMSKYIGSVRLSDLDIPKVNAWMSRMSKEGYAPKTISKCFRLLKQALNYAIAQNLLTKNPCNFCKPPKRIKTPINALCREERSRLLELARRAQPSSALAVAIELALTTGMRRGEICALRWDDFDEEKHTISVTHALGNGEGGFYLKEPKTPGSVRTIPLTRHTYNMLLTMKEDAQWMLGKLKLPFKNFYILGTLDEQSRPYNPTQLGKDFSAFCKMNRFECTFHDLRHTFATFMIGQGVDVRTVSSYLGHASVSMTLNIYADVDPEAKAQAVSKIEDAFDDAMSVFIRDADARKREIEQAQREEVRASEDDSVRRLSANAIPFTKKELEAMLATLNETS